MEIRRLDVDVSIYRNRIQVTDRTTGKFVDQTAQHAFSSDSSLIANTRFLEDTIVRAIRQLLVGGFSLKDPIAHVVSTELPLSPSQKDIVASALREAGMREVVFDV